MESAKVATLDTRLMDHLKEEHSRCGSIQQRLKDTEESIIRIDQFNIRMEESFKANARLIKIFGSIIAGLSGIGSFETIKEVVKAFF